MKQKQNEWMYKAQQSRNENDEFHKAASIIHNHNVDLDNSAFSDLKEWFNTSSFDKKLQDIKDRQQNWVVPKGDPIKDAQEIAKGLRKTKTTSSQRYNQKTGEVENVSSEEQSLDHDAFMNGWIASHSNDPNKVKSAIRQTGEQDPVKAVAALGEQMYKVVQGGKDQEKVTNAGLTMENREKLLREGASFRAMYSPGQQQTPFSRTADYIQNLYKLNPKQAETVVQAIIDQLPTKGLQGKIKVGVHDGTVAIDMPDKQTGARSWVDAHPIRLDISDPNFGAKFQAAMHQEGMDISGFNQNYKGKSVQTAQPTTQNKPNKKEETNTSGTISYTDADGTVYNIPSNKAKAFEMSHPKAKKS
jgi:hypothetical protein